MDIVQERVIDLLDDQQGPALSTTTDMPVIETKPDAVQAVPPETDKVEGDAEQQGESATPSTEELDGQPAGDGPRGVGKKLAKLTAEISAEKRRADEEAEKRIRLEERLKLLEEQKAATPQVDAEPVRPSQADFPDPDAWAEALIDYADKRATYTAKQEFKRLEAEAQAKVAQTAAEEKVRNSVAAYEERAKKTKEKYADFSEVAERPDVSVPFPAVHAIMNDENGPELRYYLGKNPDVAQKLMDMMPPAGSSDEEMVLASFNISREVGRISAAINAPRSPTIPVSAAPRPIRPITVGETKVSKNPEEMSMDEYAAWRKEQNKGKAVRH